jgi:hypothetical protein
MSKHARRARRRTNDRTIEESTSEPSAADVALFIADMSLQMRSMAQAANLDLLAYLLGMTHEEAEAICRGEVN